MLTIARDGAEHIDVLIAGGGPVGLSASTALSDLGIGSHLVERHPGTAIQPKALHLSARTMEIFRAWGMADDVVAHALPVDEHAMFFGSSLSASSYVRHPIWQPNDEISPEHSRLVSQEVLEPVLREQAERRRGTTAFRHRLVELAQGDDDVLALVEDLDTGTRHRYRAKYVIAADGADSSIRRMCGIDFPGDDVHRSVNLRFRADLTTVLDGRRSAFYYVQNEALRGLIPVIDNAHDWRLHIILPQGTTASELQRPGRQLELIRAAVGVPDLEPELLPGFPWTAGARVAERYRDGRIFLTGDAAHVNPPSGGLGMNCGIQDVHNLVWKLHAVLRGRAADCLLDSYEDERRPLALRTVREAVLNHEYESAPVTGEDDVRRKHERRRVDGLVLGHHYVSNAVVPDGTDPPIVKDEYSDFVPTARPGHRAPHAWVTSHGRTTSLLDLFATDRPTVLTTAPAGAEWYDAAELAGARLLAVGGPAGDVADPDGAVTALYGIGPGGGVVVRPDGFVAARTATAYEGGPAAFVLAATTARAAVTASSAGHPR